MIFAPRQFTEYAVTRSPGAYTIRIERRDEGREFLAKVDFKSSSGKSAVPHLLYDVESSVVYAATPEGERGDAVANLDKLNSVEVITS